MTEGLILENVSHAYERSAVVQSVSVAVGPGELVCLLGPSGCGKTTVLRLAAGLEALQQGRIAIHGRVVAEPGHSLAPERRGVGLVFQDYALFPHLTVGMNIAFGLDRLDAAERRQRVTEVLAQVGMEGFADTYPHQLSGGQQQRIALARALAPRPSVMLLDEPFSGLDVTRRAALRDTTLHVLKESGVATLMVTHDPEEAMFMADRIVLMNEGRVIQAGAPEQLYFHPADRFVAGFFGEVNVIESHVRDGCAATPFGPVPAPGFDDGAAVEVLIRPEALRIDRLSDIDDPIGAGKVTAARLLGRSSLIHLCSGDFFGQHIHMHARIPGRRLPPENETVAVSLDESQAFVFAKG